MAYSLKEINDAVRSDPKGFAEACDCLLYTSPAKKKQKSLETMEIYAPIAHRLGMQRMDLMHLL